MPIPFDMVAVMLFLGFYAAESEPSPPGLAVSAGIAAAFAVLLAAVSYAIDRAALARATSRSANPEEKRQAAFLGESAVRIALAGLYIAALVESALPWSVVRHFGPPSAGQSAAQLVGLAVYFVFFACAWLPMFPLHKAATPGRWTRRTFLLEKARYNLYILAAWIPFTLFSEWLSDFLIALPLLFFLAAWTFPWVLRKLWGCKPLADPEILAMIAELEKKAGAKFSRTLVWEPGGGAVQNAAAVGIFRPFRYLFLTPALLRAMNRDELAGVVLHELGHVKHRHLLFYLFTTLAGVNLAVLVSEILPLQGDMEAFAVIALLVFVYFRFGFGWLSRTMERQADLFALEISGSASGLTNALEKLALGAGRIRLVHSWHHLGIAERVRFLRLAGENPAVGDRHNRMAGRRKFAGYAVSLGLLAAMAAACYDNFHAVRRGPGYDRARQPAHWRRVMELLPGNAVGPLELAYSLSRDPGSRDEAIRLAAKAIGLATVKEEREAAEKLIENLTGETE